MDQNREQKKDWVTTPNQKNTQDENMDLQTRIHHKKRLDVQIHLTGEKSLFERVKMQINPHGKMPDSTHFNLLKPKLKAKKISLFSFRLVGKCSHVKTLSPTNHSGGTICSN